MNERSSLSLSLSLAVRTLFKAQIALALALALAFAWFNYYLHEFFTFDYLLSSDALGVQTAGRLLLTRIWGLK